MIELPKRSRPDIHADINIVPYIDVMLVLLVIFMMTTPIICLLYTSDAADE